MRTVPYRGARTDPFRPGGTLRPVSDRGARLGLTEDAAALDLDQVIRTYRYWAILGGTFLEGETILVLAGFAAHRGYLDLPPVIGAVLWAVHFRRARRTSGDQR